MCARFLSNLSFLYIGRVHGAISGCTVLGEVHPVSAQNKSLISDPGLDATCRYMRIQIMKEPCQVVLKGVFLLSYLRCAFHCFVEIFAASNV